MAFQLEDSVRRSLEDLCRKYRVKSLKVFGSAASAAYAQADSDIDLLVQFDEPPERMRPATQFFGFKEDLEVLLGHEIDLLEEHAIENEHLRKSALSGAVTLYAA